MSICIIAMFVAVTAEAQPYLYSLSYTGGVKVFDTATNTFVPNSIPLPPAAVGFAVSPSGDRVYLSGTSTIVVVDTATHTQIASINVPGCLADDAERVRVRPQNDILYFACMTGIGTFSLFPITISGNSYTVQPAIVTAPGQPIGIAINSAGTRMWIARRGVDVLAVNLQTNATTSIPAIVDTNGLTDIAYNPVLNRIYVPTINGVVPIDGNNDAVLPTIGSGGMYAVGISPDGTRIYALNTAGAVGVADAATGAAIGPVTGLTADPRMALAVNPTNGEVITLGNMGSCAGGPGGPFQIVNPNTLAAGPPIPVPPTYCEPRAAGQIIVAAVQPQVAGEDSPTLSWYALAALVALLVGVGVMRLR
ncbi:MAG: hypothetical protein DMF56_14410 [Acidobacteria bacterium]|nr:MAG: hypothetical protein DMF56_14410 [Acidobacteriota bacterium]